MLAAQSMYGPHACDQWDVGEISLGRCLYRLLPEDVFDSQPLEGAGGRLALVADVRLDNREELGAALDIPAEQARQLCDAAILMAAWERWAEASFDHLVGVYAFAIWDRERRALTLARDPLGQRALHYHCGAGFFAFASMPKGLHALAEIPRAPDPDHAIDLLLEMPELGIGSFFLGVSRVEPGSFVTVTPGGLQFGRHWNPQRRPVKFASPGDYVDALREHLDVAVRAQLRRVDGPVGAHLSAGMDSSAVTTAAARLLAPSGGRVTAFTAIPREVGRGGEHAGYIDDEGPLAAATATSYPNIDHVLVRSTDRLQTETLDRDYRLFDRPLVNRCNLDWWNEINRQARDRGITVMLKGSYGNVTMSWDGLDALPEMVARGRLNDWWRLARTAVAAGTLRWKGVFFLSLAPWMPDPMWRALTHLRGGRVDEVWRRHALNPALTAGLSRDRRLRAAGVDPLPRYGNDSFAERLSLLVNSDSGALASGRLAGWGIDERDPTADRRLVEFSLNIPTEQFMAGGVMRSIARGVLADRVPRIVLEESRKGHQAADWHVPMTAGRKELARQISSLESCSPVAAVLDVPRLRHLVEDWPAEGGWEREDVIQPYRSALLCSLSVGHFLQKASGSNQ